MYNIVLLTDPCRQRTYIVHITGDHEISFSANVL